MRVLVCVSAPFLQQSSLTEAEAPMLIVSLPAVHLLQHNFSGGLTRCQKVLRTTVLHMTVKTRHTFWLSLFLLPVVVPK